MPDSWLKEIRKFFDQQKVFLVDSARFIADLRPTPAANWPQALSYLTASSAFSIVLAEVNVNLFGERVRRVATLSSVVSGQAEALVAVTILAIVTAIIFRIFGGRWLLVGTITTLMYAIAFVFPVLAILFILFSRIGSVVLSETLLFIPPSRILGLGGPETDLQGIAIAVGLTTFSFCWNAYFFWLLWAALKELYGMRGIRAGIALLLSTGGVYAISDRISAAADPLIKAFLPAFEHLFK